MAERMALLHRLEAAGEPGYTRGDLFVDVIDENGTRVGIRPAPIFAEIEIERLRLNAASLDKPRRIDFTADWRTVKQRDLQDLERDYFTRLHEDAEGNVSAIARRSGLERAHVRVYLRRHKLIT